MFIVGVSIHFAYQGKIDTGLDKMVFFKILKRTLIIFGLGILLAWFPVFTLERLSSLRIPGVLQRIHCERRPTGLIVLAAAGVAKTLARLKRPPSPSVRRRGCEWAAVESPEQFLASWPRETADGLLARRQTIRGPV